MQNILSTEQIEFYRSNGYLLIENFHDEKELSEWRNAVREALKERGGRKGHSICGLI
jgi:phytanoyl-CoA hydroxylase